MSFAVQSYALHSRVIDDLNNLSKLDNLWIKSDKPMYKDSSCQSVLDNPMSLELITVSDIRVLVPVTITVSDIQGNDVYVATPILIEDFNTAQDGDQTVIWDDVQNKPAFTGWATKVFSNGSTSDILEGTRLYYTDARVKTYADTLYLPIAGIAASKVTSGVFDLARIPALPSSNTIVCTTIPAMTSGDQLLVAKGTVVIESTTGNTYRYSGTGSVILNASYIQQSDMSPDWATITNRPINISTWTNDSGYISTLAGDARYSQLGHTHLWADITDKPASFTPTAHIHAATDITQTASYRFATDAEKSTWNAKQNAITTGTTAQYLRGDLSLATFPTTWAWGALTGVPTGVAQLGNPTEHGNLRLGTTIVGGWHGIEAQDPNKTKILLNDSAGNNILGFYGLNTAKTGNVWYVSFNRDSVMVDGWVPWSRLTNVPATFAPSAHTHSLLNITDRNSNYVDSNYDVGTAKLLRWKAYTNHMICDMSAGTAPDGTTHSASDAEIAWTGTYPTIMGWNGTNTYGVKVDRARLSDFASSIAWTGISGKPTTLGGYGITDAATSTHSHPFYVQGQNGSRTTEWTANTPFSAINYSGFFNSALAPDSPTPNTWAHLIHSDYTGNDDWSFDIAANFITGNNENYFMRVKHANLYETNSPTGNGWRKLWHDGNLGFSDLIGNANYQGFYSTDVTKSGINYAIVWNKDGTTTSLNGTIGVYINISDSNKFGINKDLATFNVPVQGTFAYLSKSLGLNSPTTHDTFDDGPCAQWWDTGSNAWGLKLQNSTSVGGAKHFGIHWYGNIDGGGIKWNWVGSFARNTPSGQSANSGGVFDYAGASMGSWVGSGWTWFGRGGLNANEWSGFMQDANGKTLLGSKSGQPVQLCVAQTKVLEANSAGIDVTGTGTFSGIAQATKFRATDYTSSYANLILATGATNSYTGIVSTAGAVTPTMQFAQVTTNGAIVRNAHIIAANGQFNGVTLRYYTSDGATDYTDYAGMYSNGVAWHQNTFSFLTHTTNIASYINAKNSIEIQLTATDLSKRVSVISAQKDRIDFNSFTHNNGSLVQGLAMVQTASGLVGLYVRDIYGTTPTWGTVGIQWYSGDSGSEVNLIASKGSLSASASWTANGFNIDKGMYVKTYTKSSTATTAATATVLSDGFNFCNPLSINPKYALPGAIEGRVIRVHIPGGGPVSATVYGGTDGTTLISKQDGTSATSWTFSGGYTFVAYNNAWWVC